MQTLQAQKLCFFKLLMFIDIFIFNGYSNVSMIFCHFIVRIEFYNGIARFL